MRLDPEMLRTLEQLQSWATMGNFELHCGPKSCPVKLRGRLLRRDEELSKCG